MTGEAAVTPRTGVTKGRGWLGFLEPASSEKGPCGTGLTPRRLAVLVLGSAGGKLETDQLTAASEERTSRYGDTDRHKTQSRESLPPGFQAPPVPLPAGRTRHSTNVCSVPASQSRGWLWS